MRHRKFKKPTKWVALHETDNLYELWAHAHAHRKSFAQEVETAIRLFVSDKEKPAK